MTAELIEYYRNALQESMNSLVDKIGPIKIGSRKQFPYGWRKAAKGRTVWRIIEEIITQNLEKHHSEFGLIKVEPSKSEVSVYDMVCYYEPEAPLYINVKSSVIGGRKNKDDISKADGLIQFYNDDPTRILFISTFFIRFNDNMSITIDKTVVFPVAWINDLYVNPSNNGNLQSGHYKDLSHAVKRSNEEFLPLLSYAVAIAEGKRANSKDSY